MIINKRGSSRWVIIIGNLAFKIPSLYSYRRFLYGLLANMQEKEFSKVRDMKDKLCPVLFTLPLGFLVVMPKVRVLNEGELSEEYLDKYLVCNEDYKIPAETKDDSFGYLNNRLVVIDYGN